MNLNSSPVFGSKVRPKNFKCCWNSYGSCGDFFN